MIKVALTGSESTGKTELARKLGEHFNAPVSREFVREYVVGREGPLGYGDHGPIAKGQMAAEDDAIARATNLVFLDTDLVSTVVYCDHYFGRCPAWIDELARSRRAQLYLLMTPDIPWEPDGVRDRGERRDEMHALFAAKLRALKLTYVEIGGDRDERLARAVEAVEQLTL